MAAIKIEVHVVALETAPSDTSAPPASPIHQIVVPLDGTPDAERAVPVGAALAATLGARLHLLTTADDLPESSPTAYLERVAKDVGGTVDTEVALDQDPATAIVQHTTDERTAVCMATHARGRLLGALHAGVSDEVLHEARGLVVLVGPHCTARELGNGPVVVAHDGTRGCTDSSAPLVALAGALRRPVRLVRVASAPSAKPVDHPYSSTDEAIAPLLDLARSFGVDAEERIVFGTDVARSLLDAAGDASMFAMATHGRRGLDRFRDGSVTMAVTHDAAVPVVTRHVDEQHPAGDTDAATR